MPVALVDCNNFYVSCERVFNPRLAGRPVVVLSNNDGNVVSRSNEAKEIGIGMGVPAFQLRDLLKRREVDVFSSNYTLYADMSSRVREVLSLFCDRVEMYSIDECFLGVEMSDTEAVTLWGRKLKAEVERWTGIPVTVGVGDTKSLAKIANKVAKKSSRTKGVLNLAGSPHVDRALEKVPVGDVWGVGPSYERLLEENGIRTALDLKHAPEAWVRSKMTVVGHRIVRELNGIPCIALETIPPPKKNMGTSRGFGVPVESLVELQEAAASYTARVAQKIRLEGQAVTTLLVWLATDPFKNGPQYQNAVSVELPVATDHSPLLVDFAKRAVAELYKPGYQYKRVGVLFQGLVPVDQVQANLFWSEPVAEHQKLMRALDQVNGHMGAGTLRLAAEGGAHRWSTRFGRLSPRSTTRWGELPVARALDDENEGRRGVCRDLLS
jgi:DNA polymerase V